MKQFLALTAVLLMGTIIFGCASNGTPLGAKKTVPTISIKGPVTLDKKGIIEVSGSGFIPNSEIILLFRTTDGVQSDIGDTLEPAPHANVAGNWKTTWKYGRLIKKKLINEGSYTLNAVDGDYNKLSSVTFSFKK